MSANKKSENICGAGKNVLAVLLTMPTHSMRLTETQINGFEQETR